MFALLLALAQPGFACTASGTKLLVPAMSAEAACARLKTALAASGTRFDQAGIIVRLRFEKPGIARAQVGRSRRGTVTQLPEISVATSDRAMGPSTIDLLAREIAARLAKR